MTMGLSAGVYFEEESSSLRQIEGISTSKIAAVGVTERGPIATPTRSVSWPDWVKIFGGYTANSDLPQAIFGAFQNGAREVITVRVVHFSDITNPNAFTATKATGNMSNAGGGSSKATVYARQKAPYSLANGQTLILVKDSVTQPTVTIQATRASKTSGNTENQDMSGGKTLTVDIDSRPTQTVTFVNGDFASPAAATAEEVAAVINNQLVGARAYDSGGAVVIESDTLGTGSKVEITGGDADTTWNWGTVASNGTGNVANVAAVTIAELKTLIESIVSGITVSDDGLGYLKIEHDTAGTTKTLQVDAGSTLDTPLVLDNNSHAGLDSAGTPASKTSTLAGPWGLADGDTLDVTTDLGGPTTATFNGTKASLTSAAETYDMTGDPTLVMAVDNGPDQTLNFPSANFAVPGAATAEEIVEEANQQLTGARFVLVTLNTVRIESDSGGYDSRLQLKSGTAISKLGFGATMAFGTGNVANIGAVTFEEVKAVLEAAVVGIRCTEDSSDKLVLSRSDAGVTGTIDTPSGTALTKFAFSAGVVTGTTGSPATTGVWSGKTEGTYAAGLVVRIENASSGDADEFNVRFLRSGVLQELWPNLTMGAYDGVTLPTDARYVPTIINHATNGSNLLSFADSLIVGTASDRRPANGDYALSGGDDGLTGLVDTDFLGDSAGQNGLRALDTIQDASILIVPGRATSAVHNGMTQYCEVTRKGRLFPILDPPSSTTWQGMQTYVKTTASLKNSTEFGAIYWPEILITNPSTSVFGNAETLVVPPSGHIAGMYVRTDLSQQGGVYKEPAGTRRGRLVGAVGVADKDVNREAVRDALYPDNINPIHVPFGQPLHVDGSRNLDITGDFNSISIRRGTSFIEYSLVDGLAWVKHEDLNDDLYEEVDRTVRRFLIGEMEVDAFASKDPDKAFYTDFGPGLNPETQKRQKKLNGRIGLAWADPAEFVGLIITRDNRALEEELQAQLQL